MSIESDALAVATQPFAELVAGDPFCGLRNLTPSELMVAVDVADGLPRKEIAYRLRRSIKTVDAHLGNVYAKLEIHKRNELKVIVETWQRQVRGEEG